MKLAVVLIALLVATLALLAYADQEEVSAELSVEAVNENEDVATAEESEDSEDEEGKKKKKKKGGKKGKKSKGKKSKKGKGKKKGKKSTKKCKKGKKGKKCRAAKNKKNKKSKKGDKPTTEGKSKMKPTMEIAIQDEAVLFGGDDGQRQTVYTRGKQIGATYVRQMVYMGRLHSCLPPDWQQDATNKYDRLIREAKANGYKVQITLTGIAANWGNVCGGISTGSPPNLAEWKAFVTKWVPFFYARGVRRIGLWNEPNLPAFLCAGKTVTGKDVDHYKCTASAGKNAAIFYQLYSSGYKIILGLQKAKKIGRVKIWIGEWAGATGVSFTERILKKHKLKADALSWHPYQYCTAPNVKGKKFTKGLCRRAMNGIGYVKDVQKTLKKWAKSGRLTTPGGKRVPMYLTEFGYHRRQPSIRIPEKWRAKWYPKALELARKAGTKGFVLYQFYPQNQAWDTSLLETNGAPTASFLKIRAWAKSRGYKLAAL